MVGACAVPMFGCLVGDQHARGTDIFAAMESRPWVDLISHFSIVRKTECDPMAFEVNEHLAAECEFSNHFLD